VIVPTCPIHRCHIHDCFRKHYPQAFRDPPPSEDSAAAEANRTRAAVTRAMENLRRARNGDVVP
jgi:hypothetical protein